MNIFSRRWRCGWLEKVTNLQLESAECFRIELANACWRFILLSYQPCSGSLQASLIWFCFSTYRENKFSFCGYQYSCRHRGIHVQTRVFAVKWKSFSQLMLLASQTFICRVATSCKVGDWLHIITCAMKQQMAREESVQIWKEVLYLLCECFKTFSGSEVLQYTKGQT